MGCSDAYVQSAYNPSTFSATLDAPFCLIYLAVAFLLSPILALVAFIGLLCALAFGRISLIRTRKTVADLQELSASHRGLVFSAANSRDTVRSFEAGNFLSRNWKGQIQRIINLRQKLADKKEQSQSFTLTSSLLMSLVLYAVGAPLVVKGELTVGALIGANILASRGYQSIVRFVQTAYLLNDAKDAHKKLKDFLKLPLEAEGGTAMKQYKGGIRFKDLGFAYLGSPMPLYESLDLELKPGNIMVVIGKNGTGKTTLARLVVGLLTPSRGAILVDGISLRQIDPGWWRRQIIYFPQEPQFLNATIKENITMIHSGDSSPGISDADLSHIITAADLRNFLDNTPEGLGTRITDGARHLSLGIRRRLALARALTTNGRLAVLDEPTEGLDADGCKAVYDVMNNIVKTGRTVVAFSNDPLIIKGAQYVLDLNEKPIPKISMGTQRQISEQTIH